jgi:transposase
VRELAIGVDVGSKACQICVKNMDRKTLLNQKVHNLSLDDFLQKHLIKVAPPDRSVVLMESTGKAYYLFPRFVFEKNGYEVRVENPRFISRYAEGLSVRGKKTDSYDAEVLALYCLERVMHSYKVSYLPNDLKSTVRHWAKLRKTKQEIEGHTFSQALVVFPLIDEVFGGSPLKSKTGRRLLKEFAGWHEVYSVGLEGLEERLMAESKRGRGKKELVRKLYRYAELLARSGYRPSEMQVKLLRLALEELQRFEEVISYIEARLVEIGEKAEEVWLLRSIPGIGELSSVVLYAEIGDVERFRDRDDLWAYFGFDPRNEESGESVRKSSRISRAGIGYVRGILYMIAFGLTRKGMPYYETYWELRRRGKKHREALIVIAHKLVRIMYQVLKEKNPCRKFSNFRSEELVDFEGLSYEFED